MSPNPDHMRRRDFLATAGGVATTAAAGAGTASAQGQPEFPNYLGDARGGNFEDLRGRSELTVEVGVGSSNFAFDPTKIWIDPGTTVTFSWQSVGHNVLPKSTPSDSGWEGYEPLENSGFTYSHTFETEGIYTYFCDPHEDLGMKGGIAVGEVGGGGEAGGGGGGEELTPEEMGVPFRAHFVGIATLLGIAASLVFTFYQLKYGESPHSSSPNRK